jgi:hypothetical protein
VQDGREIGTAGKVAMIGTATGAIHLVDVGSKSKVSVQPSIPIRGSLFCNFFFFFLQFQIADLPAAGSSVEACEFLRDQLAVIGCQSGNLYAYDVRNPKAALATSSRRSGVVSLVADEKAAGIVTTFGT